MRRDLVVLTACAVSAFAVLVALGTWQMQRLAWKENLIARIEARTAADPASLGEVLSRLTDSGNDIEYTRVRLKGAFMHDGERHLFNVVKGESGWQVVTPFRTDDGHIVIVDRGFVPMALKDPASRPEGQVAGEHDVVGLVRLPEEQAMFAPDNDAASNEWYWRDLDAMARSLPTDGAPQGLVPFFVALEAQDVPGGWPRAGTTRLDLPNKHLQYAFTWYGLAATLVFVYALFVWKRYRRGAFT